MLQKLIYSRFSKSELKKQIELILKEKISISSNVAVFGIYQQETINFL